jgi:BirA family transcriptional regulator, biotin operon repressor / biotin---[acetyl-CoA-carboxylase] ligase
MLKWSFISKNYTTSLDEVESTNTYAVEKVKNGLSLHGEVVVARHQTKGKGQRKNTWTSEKGLDLALSFIIHHEQSDAIALPILNMAISLAVRNTVAAYITDDIKVKWPNDIMVGDKKIAGILIENVWQGMDWKNSVVGIGLNINSTIPVDVLPNATSIVMEKGEELPIYQVQNTLVENLNKILNLVSGSNNNQLHEILAEYNSKLYKKDSIVPFLVGEVIASYKIVGVLSNGKIKLESTNGFAEFSFGEASLVFAQKA